MVAENAGTGGGTPVVGGAVLLPVPAPPALHLCCDVCNRQFATVEKLQNHKKTHKPVRNNFLKPTSCKNIKEYTPMSTLLWQTIYP